MHEYTDCTDVYCGECQRLVDEGFILACDECGVPGSTDVGYPFWQLKSEGRTLCWECAEPVN